MQSLQALWTCHELRTAKEENLCVHENTTSFCLRACLQDAVAVEVERGNHGTNRLMPIFTTNQWMLFMNAQSCLKRLVSCANAVDVVEVTDATESVAHKTIHITYAFSFEVGYFVRELQYIE